VHVSEPLVMLTELGRQTVQPERQTGVDSDAQALQVPRLRRGGPEPSDASAEASTQPRPPTASRNRPRGRSG
jgi:hypothetical protein